MKRCMISNNSSSSSRNSLITKPVIARIIILGILVNLTPSHHHTRCRCRPCRFFSRQPQKETTAAVTKPAVIKFRFSNAASSYARAAMLLLLQKPPQKRSHCLLLKMCMCVASDQKQNKFPNVECCLMNSFPSRNNNGHCSLLHCNL
jgi:hypothetical protein